MECQIIESRLNNHSLDELEIMNNHAVYIFPIGIEYRNERNQFVYRDGANILYGGSYLNTALKAMEKRKGTILYTGI